MPKPILMMVATLCVLHSVKDYLLDDGTLFLLAGSLLLHGCEVVARRIDSDNLFGGRSRKIGDNFFKGDYLNNFV
jgi:hypothetical protein